VLVGTLSWGQGCVDAGSNAVVYDREAQVEIPALEDYSLYLGGAIPDFVDYHRLGPWAALYRWRYSHTSTCGGTWIPGTPGTPGTSGQPPVIKGQTTGGSPLGGGAPRRGRTIGGTGGTPGTPGHWEGTRTTTVAFYTYGPLRKIMRQISRFTGSYLEDSGFYGIMYSLTLTKLKYMFYHLHYDTPPPVLTSYDYPVWVHVDSYPAAKALASSDPNKIKRTGFYALEIVSSIPKGDPNFLTPGTYQTNNGSGRTGLVPVRRDVYGWEDPALWNIPRIADYIWAEDYQYWITYYPEIGIEPEQIPGGGEWDLQMHPVYVYGYYIWAGVDIGEAVDVRNPCNWVTPPANLPTPWLYDPDDGWNDYNPDNPNIDRGVRRRHFSFLGIVQRDTRTRVWPTQFRHRNPLGGMAAVAQAKVFNNRSWDLWTQNWRAQLTPVTRFTDVRTRDLTTDDLGLDWMSRMEDGRHDLGEAGDLIYESQYYDLLEYFEGIDPDMAEEFFNH
ncbi:MAG: hypothetical protein ACYTFO_09580, partial [Planctomycetota bacterium]